MYLPVFTLVVTSYTRVKLKGIVACYLPGMQNTQIPYAALPFFKTTGLPHPNTYPQFVAGSALQPLYQGQLSFLDTVVEQYLWGGITLSLCTLYPSALGTLLSAVRLRVPVPPG